MNPISRRDALTGMLSGASVMLLAPTLPGCATPQTAGPGLGGGGQPTTGPTGAGAADGAAAVARAQALFGVDSALAHKVLGRALQRGGAFADLYLEHRVSDSLKLEEQKVNVAAASVEVGAGVRVVVGDQCGYAYTESLTEADLLQAADTAALIAKGKAQGAPPDFTAVAVPALYPVQTAPTELPVADKMTLLHQVDQAARAASDAVRVVIAFTNSELHRVLLYCSDGRVMADERPYINLGTLVSVARGDRTERNWYSEGGMRDMSFYGDGRTAAIAKEAVKRATLCLEAVSPPAGEMPVVLAPGEAGILLHEAVGHGLEADFNRKGVSIYSGRVGQKVASPLCTVIDDGTVAHSRGAVGVDDEGTVGQRTVLIDKGVLKGYMNDQIGARTMKTAPTGNGRRQSYKFHPIPRMTTTYMLAGPHSKEEVFEGVKRGIYAISFSNGQVNIGAGDYTFFVNYGFLIEDGKPTRPIKDVNIIGNGPQSLERVDRVAGDLVIPNTGAGYCGKDGQRVPVGFGLPHLRISKVTVGGRAGAPAPGKKGGAA